ncbi:MAG TPA: methionine--tRNA ligase [bacterium]|nr:methionine--tRNA ligase [bacterium]
MDKKFYLTTTLPYVNADPHMGHALEFIEADIIVRYMREKLGIDNVFFNVGTDEHGLKIYNKAQENNKTPQEFVDFYAERFKEFCKILNISYNNFYRTSDEKHKKVVQSFWNKSLENGDIYKKKYEGLYCVGCEAFKSEKDLIDGKCPEHNIEPIKYSEENYFFRLSKYRKQLLQYIEEHNSFIIPSIKIDELKNFVENMEDISISRIKDNLPWGINVPEDDEQVVYVWFDALSNYVGAIGFPDNLDLDYANNMYQICGPDNLRFQGGIWQGMLMSIGLPNSKKIIVHGTILGPDGLKMSKAIGNIVSPFEQIEKFGYEALRFYLAYSFGFNNSAYKEDDLKNLYNSILADSFGNLLARVIHLANSKDIEINNFEKVDKDFKDKVDFYIDNFNKNMDQFYINYAVSFIGELSNYGNQYIQENKPWEKDKNIEDVEIVLNNLSYLLYIVADLYKYIIPESAEKAKQALKNKEKIILFNKLS